MQGSHGREQPLEGVTGAIGWGCVNGWVGGWVGGKVGGWVGGWVGTGAWVIGAVGKTLFQSELINFVCFF